MKVFIFDSAKCNGCHSCQLACKDEHCGNDWSPYAKPQPDTGHFWMKMQETEHGQIPKIRVEYRTVFCQHCDNAPCIAAGNGAVYKREDGLVIIDPEKAQNNEALVQSCPYGAIYWNSELKLAQKCTGCAHLIDEGEEPRCADFCTTGGLRFGEEEDFADEIAQAETLLPELGTKPRVYYLNLPKLFIGGEVWDPGADLIIKNAVVSLEGGSGFKAQTTTDGFGDFWFKKLEPGTYSLTIEAEGFATKKIENIDLQKSLNLGDFPMERVGGSAVASDETKASVTVGKKTQAAQSATVREVRGTVCSLTTKAAVPDAIVSLRGASIFKTSTDSEGAFRIEVPEGNYLINIKYAGYRSYGQNITVDKDMVCEPIMLEDAKPSMTSFS